MARTAVGCHIYSGAFSLGMGKHFDVLGQLEEGPWGYNTTSLNFPGIHHPMERKGWEVDYYKNLVNVVYANPPCACWSNIGSRLGKADPRINFTYNAANFALEVEPDFFIVESVCRAWTAGKDVYKEIAERFIQKGYGITYLLTNALLHGAPQSRERFHLIAHKHELPLVQPAVPTDPINSVMNCIGSIALTPTFLEPGTDILKDPVLPNHVVRPPTEMELEVYKVLKPGANYNETVTGLQQQGIPAKKGRLISGRLYPDAYSRTLVDVGCVVHPTEDRLLTQREGARLCTYPDDFRFAPDSKNKEYGSQASDVTQVVIPLMGEFLGKLFADAMDNEAPAKGVQEVDWRPIARPFTPGRYAKAMGWKD